MNGWSQEFDDCEWRTAAFFGLERRVNWICEMSPECLRGTEKLGALDQSFVRHHRIKEQGMRGAVTGFGFDHPEFLRYHARAARQATQLASRVRALHGRPRIMRIRIERARFGCHPQMD